MKLYSTSDLYQPTAGLSNVGSYQVSSIPWVSSSLVVPVSASAPLEIQFPYVTRDITIKNTSSRVLRVGFSANGIKGKNYFTLNNSEAFSADLRITKLYLLSDSGTLTGSATVVAGLTGIASSQLPNSWSGSAGIG